MRPPYTGEEGPFVGAREEAPMERID
jgi:hypothetical protein